MQPLRRELRCRLSEAHDADHGTRSYSACVVLDALETAILSAGFFPFKFASTNAVFTYRCNERELAQRTEQRFARSITFGRKHVS